MSSFWNLTQFEYKKIFRKTSTVIVLVITLLLTVISCGATLLGDVYVEGVPTQSQMEAMETDRAYSLALAGRAVNSELLLEMGSAYGKIPHSEKYTATEEYDLYARPYSDIYSIARVVYSSEAGKFELADAQSMTQEQANSFYEIRADKVAENIDSMVASAETKARLLHLNNQIETPLIFNYTEGYTRFFSITYTTALMISFVAAILLAPLFSGEYSSGADQLILSSKHGKGKLILAKLFTGITIAGGMSLFLMGLTYFQCMLTYGFDGSDAALQIYLPLCDYPLTMGQAALLCSICIFLGTFLIAGITMLLSSKMKTSFGVIILISILIIVPMFVSDPETSAMLSNLFCLLPTNMMAFWKVITPHLFEVGSASVEPYIAMPIFAGVMTMVLLFFAYRGFKHHQIG